MRDDGTRALERYLARRDDRDLMKHRQELGFIRRHSPERRRRVRQFHTFLNTH